MNDELIELIIAKLSSAVVLILTNKSKILIAVVAVHILRRILKTIYHRHQFPIFTAKHNNSTTTATKTLYCSVCLHDVDGGQRYPAAAEMPSLFPCELHRHMASIAIHVSFMPESNPPASSSSERRERAWFFVFVFLFLHESYSKED
ncbi:unnamed protein product [Lactuca saligna]|uniref:Uncharacterized protein n=1 Tax=Lactuca saligna TaxID=75948 RepID=A0AA36E276_LACSI|nr:unnamed protein product [Lactuca saligna]